MIFSLLIGACIGLSLLIIYQQLKLRRQRGEMAQMAQIGANIQAQRDAAIKVVQHQNLEDDYNDALGLQRTTLAAMAEAHGVDPEEYIILDELEENVGN